MTVPRPMAPADAFRSGSVGIRPVTLACTISRRARLLQVAQDFAEAEHAHADDDEADAVGQFRNAPGHALGAGLEVRADHRQQQTRQDHGQRLEHRALGEHDREDQAEHHQREVFGRAEQQRERGQRRAERRHQHGRDAAGEERADRGDGERRAGAALLGHLVAVEAGDHRRRFTWDVDQDRRGRAAVLRAVVDAGEHDERADRRQAEGDRQQHGDGGERADARQHADQRADQRTDQAQEDVGRRDGHAHAEPEICNQVIHGAFSPITRTGAKAGTAGSSHRETGRSRMPSRRSATISVSRHFTSSAAAAQMTMVRKARDHETERPDALRRSRGSIR